MDRGYANFVLFNKIAAAKSGYVCRICDNSAFEVIEERLLSGEALKADIVQDAVVLIGQSSKSEARPDHPIRVVTIQITPHVKRGKYKGGSTGAGSDRYL